MAVDDRSGLAEMGLLIRGMQVTRMLEVAAYAGPRRPDRRGAEAGGRARRGGRRRPRHAGQAVPGACRLRRVRRRRGGTGVAQRALPVAADRRAADAAPRRALLGHAQHLGGVEPARSGGDERRAGLRGDVRQALFRLSEGAPRRGGAVRQLHAEQPRRPARRRRRGLRLLRRRRGGRHRRRQRRAAGGDPEGVPVGTRGALRPSGGDRPGAFDLPRPCRPLPARGRRFLRDRAGRRRRLHAVADHPRLERRALPRHPRQLPARHARGGAAAGDRARARPRARRHEGRQLPRRHAHDGAVRRGAGSARPRSLPRCSPRPASSRRGSCPRARPFSSSRPALPLLPQGIPTSLFNDRSTGFSAHATQFGTPQAGTRAARGGEHPAAPLPAADATLRADRDPVGRPGARRSTRRR